MPVFKSKQWYNGCFCLLFTMVLMGNFQETAAASSNSGSKSSENTHDSSDTINGNHESVDVNDGTHVTENSTEHHGNDTDGHHEEHLSRHVVVWPATVGMMLFISLMGYTFYRFYTKMQVREALEKDGKCQFFKKAIVSSTVAGVATPGIIGFAEKNCPVGADVPDNICRRLAD